MFSRAIEKCCVNLQIYIYLVARRDVLRFEMSHRQKITATFLLAVDPLARRYGEDRDYHSAICEKLFLWTKTLMKVMWFIRCSGSLIFCLLKGFCHIELDLVLELLNFELGYFLARKCYCLEQSLLNLSTIIVQLEDILW